MVQLFEQDAETNLTGVFWMVGTLASSSQRSVLLKYEVQISSVPCSNTFNEIKGNKHICARAEFEYIFGWP